MRKFRGLTSYGLLLIYIESILYIYHCICIEVSHGIYVYRDTYIAHIAYATLRDIQVLTNMFGEIEATHKETQRSKHFFLTAGVNVTSFDCQLRTGVDNGKG